jgi:hypothetical protein
MKLRIRANSIRLRVTRPELEQLASTGRVAERVPFPAGTELRYELVVDPQGRLLTADYRSNAVRVMIPAQEFRQWQREDQVSLRATQPTGGAELTILVEKDFPCLTPREGEDDSTAFPHPAGPTTSPR